MELRKTVITLAVLVMCASTASAAVLLIDDDKDNSGWVAYLGGATTGIQVIDVDWDAPTPMVKIVIQKDFTQGETLGVVTFSQEFPPDDNLTVPRIVIDYEDIQNNSGEPWHTFRWDVTTLTPDGAARVDKTSWDGWHISTWYDNHEWLRTPTTDTLIASGGPGVPDGGSFKPGWVAGDLEINVDLDASLWPISFTLRQTATPEPSCLVFFMAAAGFLLRRAKRQGRG